MREHSNSLYKGTITLKWKPDKDTTCTKKKKKKSQANIPDEYICKYFTKYKQTKFNNM